MQSDPSKQGYNNYGNVYPDPYPPMNEPILGTRNVVPYVIFFTQNFTFF